ncbi:hypothetical protein Tco_0609309 [Tanacetum coccineum]
MAGGLHQHLVGLIGGQVSSVNFVDIDAFCLHDLKDMVVKLGYSVENLMYCHFLIPSLDLDYGLHSLNVDAGVLEMAKYVKDYKIILVYVEHRSSNVDTSIFVTPKKGVVITVDNHLRKAPIEIDSSPDPSSSVEALIVVECAKDPFEELDDILGVGPVGKFKEVEVDADNESKKKSDSLIPLEQWRRAYFSGRAKCDLLINNICDVFNRQLVDGIDQPIITCLEYIIEYLMKRIVVVQKVIAKIVGPLTPSVTKMFDAIKIRLLGIMKWELTGIPCKHDVAAIYNMSKNSVGVGIPEQWVHAAYRLETWAHVYSFKVNPCNGRDMRPVVESRTVIIPPLYKPQFGRPPKKRKKSNDEIASQSASSGKLSRKGKSVSCGKYGNVGHNRKGCMGQGSGSSQVGARKVSGQAAGATNVSG